MNSVSFTSRSYPAQALQTQSMVKTGVRFAGNPSEASKTQSTTSSKKDSKPDKPNIFQSIWNRFTRLFKDIKKTIVHFFSRNPEKTETEIQLKQLKNNLAAIFDEKSLKDAHKGVASKLEAKAPEGSVFRQIQDLLPEGTIAKWNQPFIDASKKDESAQKWQTEKVIPLNVHALKQLNATLSKPEVKAALQKGVVFAPQVESTVKRAQEDANALFENTEGNDTTHKILGVVFDKLNIPEKIANTLDADNPEARKMFAANITKHEYQQQAVQGMKQPFMAILLPKVLQQPKVKETWEKLKADPEIKKAVAQVYKDKNASQEFKDLLKQITGL